MAIGYESRKTYAKGDTKAECFRKLQKEFPYPVSKKGKNTLIDGKPVYTEPLKIIKRSR